MTTKVNIARIILAHGAGQGMESEFMQSCQNLFEAHGIACQLFNFDYMATMMAEGKRKPPDRMPKLLERFQKEIVCVGDDIPLFIGGKSMGGRVATHLLSEQSVKGALCFGYPFHPPGKPEKLRTEHLVAVEKPVLILQGERDPFGKKDEIERYTLSKDIKVKYINDGEHSFKPGKRSGQTWEANLKTAIESSVAFIKSVLE